MPPQPWPQLAALFLLTGMVESMAMGHLFNFLPLFLVREIGVPPADVAWHTGWLSASMFLLGLPLVPFWGVWADRYSRKVVIVRSALIEAAVLFLLATSQGLGQLAFALLLSGLQLGNTGVMLAAIRQAAPPGRMGLALALVSLGGPIGQAVGPAAGGWLVDTGHVSLRGLFVGDAALSLLIAILLVGFQREDRPTVIPTDSMGSLALRSLTNLYRLPPARRHLATMALMLTAGNLITPFLALIVERLSPDPASIASHIGVVSGAAALMGILASPLAGMLGDRIGHRFVLRAALALGVVALGGMTFVTSIRALAVLSAFLGASVASVVALVYALLALELAPEHRSPVLNLAFIPFYVGGLLGPGLGAFLITHLGLAALFPAAAALALAALLLGSTKEVKRFPATPVSPG